MGKAEIKTKATEAGVADFILALPDARRREEAAVIDAMHERVTGQKARMWGPSIIGYGSYDYVYDSGRSGTMCRAGFSPRKTAMTLYLMGHYCDRQPEAGCGSEQREKSRARFGGYHFQARIHFLSPTRAGCGITGAVERVKGIEPS